MKVKGAEDVEYKDAEYKGRECGVQRREIQGYVILHINNLC